MKNSAKISSSNNGNKNGTNGFIPSSLKFISSCIKTASSGVRSASASVAASLSGDANERKDQVLWASFDKLEVDPSSFKHVLLLGYSNGFQVLDVDDAANVSELVSRRDDPVTFLQMQPLPLKSEGVEGFRGAHPLLLVVADETKSPGQLLGGQDGLIRDGHDDPQTRGIAISPTTVRFYSLRSHNYVHVLRFRSTVYMVRCSPRIVAVGLATQIYCFDALTLENKFSVLTYPVPHMGGQTALGVNVGYGPMAVGSRWLAYASNNPLASNMGRLSPQSLTPPSVSPSTSPGSGNLVARYAMESSKQLAAGIINLGDRGYKTLSKYCHDLRTDGTGSPVSSNSGWKVGRAAEADVAGMVVLKDFVSRAVVSQFRAHTSPISALCFDPSGTLLVTASIYGNNINIFRIMPSGSKNAAGMQSYDWSSSHVHLYKLHRGVTSAVIQDICFSPYSQWVAIVSSKGTCHIFVLSPFGGENVLQLENSQVDGPILSPAISLPWWSSPSFTSNHFSSPAPAPVTLSVVSRIRSNYSGWLNTVSHAATTAVGKPSISSGALAAVFHRSVSSSLMPASKFHTLEHLLVYTPSGHVVQYKLLPSLGGDHADSTSRMGPGSSAQMLEEELRVRVEAVQGWDVCRRADWPEREESISGLTLAGLDIAETNMDTYDFRDCNLEHKELVKQQERSHLYLANAEVQIRSGRIPIWQNPKMSFYSMHPLKDDERNVNGNELSGEIEIEEVPTHEVEIRRKDLLPVFDHFHGVYTNGTVKGLGGEVYSIAPSHSHGEFSKISYPIINQPGYENFGPLPSPYTRSHSNGDGHFISFKQPVVSESPAEGSVSPLTNGSPSGGGTVGKELQPSNSGRISEASNASSNRSDLSMNVLDEGPVDGSPNFEQFFKEEYYKTSSSGEPQEPAQVAEMESNNGSFDKEKPEEDDDDDMLGGVFAFSEEG